MHALPTSNRSIGVASRRHIKQSNLQVELFVWLLNYSSEGEIYYTAKYKQLLQNISQCTSSSSYSKKKNHAPPMLLGPCGSKLEDRAHVRHV